MKKQIDRRQLVSLLFISRVFAVLTFSPNTSTSFEGTVSMVSALISHLVAFGFVLIIDRVLQQAPGCGLLEAAATASPLWGKIAAGTVLAVSMLVALNTGVSFYYFLATVVYPNLSTQLFVVLFTICCIYGAALGLEPLARFSLPIAVGLMAMLLLVLPVLARNVQMVYLHSPFEEGVKPLFIGALQSLWGNLELLAIACLAPAADSSPKQVYWPVMLLNLFYVQTLTFLATATLGRFGMSQAFPIYTMMASAEMIVMQRLDALHIAAWIFISFLKCSLYLYLAQRSLAQLKPTIPRTWRTVGLGLLLMVGSLLTSRRMKVLAGLFQVTLMGIPFVLTVVLLPSITLLLLHLRRKKEERTV